MMEEKAWSKLHLSLRGPQPCEKNCFGMSQDIRIVCSFLFSPFFSQLTMEEKAWFEFTSHWEALNPVKRFQNPCDAASECQDISKYCAIFFPTSSLLCEEGQSQLIQTDFIYTSPNLVKQIFAVAVGIWSQTLSLKGSWKKRSTNSSEFPRSQAERLFMKKEWLLAIKTSEDSWKGPMSSYRSAIMKMLIVFLCRPAKRLRISTSLLLALKHPLTKN